MSKSSSVAFGMSQYTTWPLTFEQDLELYQKEGITHIEVCEGKINAAKPEPQMEQLKATGMVVSSVQPRLHSLFPDTLCPEPKAPAERMARLKQTIKLFGRYFPGTTLVTIPGAVPNGDFDLGYRTAAKEYPEVAKMAADYGVKVAFEPLSPVCMNVDGFVCTLKNGGRVIESVDHPSFGFFLDVWHFWEDATACDLIRKYGSTIFGVHVNDWRTPRAFADRVLPGHGEMPLVDLLKAIHSTPYDGAYTLEIFSDKRLEGSLWVDPAKTVRDGKKAFAEIWKKVCA